MQAAGTATEDTQCEACQPGTYQPDPNMDGCIPCTAECKGATEKLARTCTSTRDMTCESLLL